MVFCEINFMGFLLIICSASERTKKENVFFLFRKWLERFDEKNVSTPTAIVDCQFLDDIFFFMTCNVYENEMEKGNEKSIIFMRNFCYSSRI